jgi:hypothetical protein
MAVRIGRVRPYLDSTRSVHMGIFDRFRGNQDNREAAGAAAADEQAIARYRYLLKTAPPETIEQAHAEAFAQLTPAQRRLVLDELCAAAPRDERPVLERVGDNPQALARYATRAEMRQPGTIERMFGGSPAMPGVGGIIASTMLGSIAGTVLGTMIAQSFLGDAGAGEGDTAGWSDSTAQDETTTAFDDSGGDFDSGSFDV